MERMYHPIRGDDRVSLDWAQKLVCELAEEAQTLEDPRRFPERVLVRVAALVGCDAAICLPLDGPRRALAQVNKGSYRKFLSRYAADPPRFEKDLARGRAAAAASNGAYLDSDVFTARERRELPFFAEIARPQGITSQVVALVRFRQHSFAVMHLERHGHSRAFGQREVEAMRALSPMLGLAHAAFRSPSPELALESLGAREREVARLAAQGLQTREIATVLGSSPNTVRNQLHRIFEKLGLSSRAELAAWLFRGAGR